MSKEPGWDSKAIAAIAKEFCGGYEQMFESHKWPERGSQMMTSAPSHIKRSYGNIGTFVDVHAKTS